MSETSTVLLLPTLVTRAVANDVASVGLVSAYRSNGNLRVDGDTPAVLLDNQLNISNTT